MTARPPHDEHDALDPEERGLAARLAASAPPGPSAALDARILAAARAASTAAPTASRRPARRWPTAVGAAATLVIAVGLAWQLKPLLDMPPPLRQAPMGPPAEVEVLAEARPIVAPAPPAAPAVADAASQADPARVAAPAPEPRRATAAARVQKAAPVPQQAPAAASHDFVDEAVGDHAHAPAAAAAAAAPPPPPPPDAAARFAETAAAAQAQRSLQAREGAAAEGVAAAFGPVSIDASLPPLEWLERIRARRAAGDIDGARESLRGFMREHPRLRVPDDLRALRAAQP